MNYLEIQENLLSLMPVWNYQIAKPFKQLLDEGISLEMYYCIRTLQWNGGCATMTEIAKWAKMPKQQMTKLVNRLVQCGFVKRFDDPSDRRIVKIQLTDKATEFIDYFIEHDASCFRPLLEKMSSSDLQKFSDALKQLIQVFHNIPCCYNYSCCEQEQNIK